MDADERSALLTVYATERQDDASALAVAFAITTTGLTYTIAAVAYLNDRCDRSGCRGVPDWLPLIAPAIAAAFVGFLILNVAATRMRSVHLQRLEDSLRVPVAGNHFEPSFHTDAGIVYRPDTPFERPGIQVVFALITYFSYGAVMVALIGFTWYVLFFVSGPWGVAKYIIGGAYAVVEIAQVLGFVLPLFQSRFVYQRPKQPLLH